MERMRSSSMERTLNEINNKLSLLVPLVAKVDALATLAAEVEGMEASIECMSELCDAVLGKLARQAKDVSVLSERVERLESGESAVMKSVKSRVNELEQYSRRQNLEIRGMAQDQNENLFEKLNDLAVKLGLPELKQSDVENVHRLTERHGKEPVVIIRFASVALKEEWAQRRSLLKSIDPKLRIFDHLTAANKRLMWLARAEAEEKN